MTELAALTERDPTLCAMLGHAAKAKRISAFR
jgi:hypothetical protein